MINMEYKSIDSILSRIITGEWGHEAKSGNGVKVIRTTNFTNSGKLRLDNVAVRDINDKIVQEKRLRFGDIILEKSGGSDNFAVGRVVYFDIASPEEYLCNNFTQVLRANPAFIDSKYLFYYLFYLHKRGVTKGLQNKTTGIRNLQVRRYLAQKVPVPLLSTQRKIASILDKAESVKQKRQEANRLTDDFLKSAFIEMFGDPFKNPKKWPLKRLDEICSVESGGTPSTQEKKYWENGDIPWLGSTACKNTFIKEPTKHITEDGLRNSAAKLFKEKTVLVALVGATIGKTGFLSFPSTTNQNIAGIYPLDKTQLIPEYLFFTMQCLYNKFFTLGSGSFKMANLSFVKKLEIIIPDIKKQQKFADLVQSVEKIKETQEESKKALNILFSALMQKAFQG